MDIIGRTFGSLMVVSSADSFIRNNGKKRQMVRCKCSCGNIVILRKDSLKSGDYTSCGCGINIRIKSAVNLIGKRFCKLVVLERLLYAQNNVDNSAVWKCICDCGKNVIKTSRELSKKNISCGCDVVFIPKWMVTAKNVYYHYRDGDISFEDFLLLSQKKCYYCSCGPTKRHNVSKPSYKNKKDYDFLFNGIDRLDNSEGHNKNNCVTACWDCNRIKHILSCNNFIRQIGLIYNNFNLDDCNVSRNEYSLDKIKIMRYIFNDYNKRNMGDISFEDFSKLCLSNCFYCNSPPSNKRKYLLKNKGVVAYLMYSGLDRIDNFLPYNLNNVVSCCKICNFMKGILHFNDFLHKINKINSNLVKNKLIL